MCSTLALPTTKVQDFLALVQFNYFVLVFIKFSKNMVELDGIEPTTSGLQSPRSPS
jgi:hypothetical protein